MAHQAQRQFFESVKIKYPQHFTNCAVIDCGSLNVNGALKDLFIDCQYIGVDIVAGNNVDIVSPVKDLPYTNEFKTVISGEMLEHDETWRESLQKMYSMCVRGGLIAISAAGKGRPEHGTRRSDGNEWGTGDYYMNIEEHHIREIFKEHLFIESYVEYNPQAKDIYFYGIKA